MLKNHDIMCISSIDWDFVWQGHQEIMTSFAARGNRVLFIENTGVRTPTFHDIPRLRHRLKNWSKGVKGIRKERENLYVFSPIILPFPYSRFARAINIRILMFYLKRWMKVMDFLNPIIWTFLPTGFTLDLINTLDKKIVIYYCIDNFSASSALAKKVEKSENKLIRQADLVFVTARELYKKCAPLNSRVHVFPFGVNIENFERVYGEKSPEIPDDIKAIPGPVIGYVGGIHKWIDFALIRRLAEARPEYSFVFVGPIQTDISKIKSLPNVHFLGLKPHEQLPDYVNGFDVGLIPYLLTDYTMNVYPTKLNEYLALSKPVVSTGLPEIEAFNDRYDDIVAVGATPEEFAERVDGAVQSPGDTDILQKRRRAAQDNTWAKRIEAMSTLIDEGIKERTQDKNLRWQENLRNFYRKTLRRLRITGAAVLLSYLAVFHSPLLWWLAGPLHMSDPPSRSDVIVAFAGGVGESGKAGQGYQERTLHTVDLYKQNYADKIVYSTGYTYLMHEAEVMKALAVSLGVPAENIILEEDAGSTYENVLFTSRIMERRGWTSALVVSSPYNMRRISLVYKKIAPDLNIILSPVPQGGFFGSRDDVEWKHIRAIIHEYLAIVYYWLTGRI